MFDNIKRKSRDLLSGRGAKTPAWTAPTRSMVTRTPSTMKTYIGGTYHTGNPVEVVDEKGREDGQMGVLNPDVVGPENSHLHVPDELAEAHGAAAEIIGHDLRGDHHGEVADIEQELVNLKETEAKALETTEANTAAERDLMVKEHEMRRLHLPIPPGESWRHVAAMLALFLGDSAMLALGFEILGLSDKRILGIPFTDELHFAALSAVAALVIFGEIIGVRLRRIEGELEVRRRSSSDDRDKHPKPAIFDIGTVIVGFSVAIYGVICLSLMRAQYLHEMGVHASNGVFIGVQILVLGAAIWLAHHNANPEKHAWKSLNATAVATKKARDIAVNAHSNSAGFINVAIDQCNTLIAQAGHHVKTDAANVLAQIPIYLRRYLLSQQEPATEKLFGDHRTPPSYEDEALLQILTGLKPLREFARVSTDNVMAALDESRTELSTLRTRLHLAEIAKLDLPELEAIGAEPAAQHDGSETPSTSLRTVPLSETEDGGGTSPIENDETGREIA